jgi:hypothetical protein
MNHRAIPGNATQRERRIEQRLKLLRKLAHARRRRSALVAQFEEELRSSDAEASARMPSHRGN